MIVRTGGRLAEARVAWREGEHGRMTARVVVGTAELAPDRVELVEVDPDRAEALAQAGYSITGTGRHPARRP